MDSGPQYCLPYLQFYFEKYVGCFFWRFLCFETILTTTVVRFGRTKRLALRAPVFLDYQAKLGFAGSPPIVENIKRDPMARFEPINVLNWKGIKETMKQNF